MPLSVCPSGPARILPFRIDRERAEELIRSHLGERGVSAKAREAVPEIRGVFFPYRAADMEIGGRVLIIGTKGHGKSSRRAGCTRVGSAEVPGYAVCQSPFPMRHAVYTTVDLNETEPFDDARLEGYYTEGSCLPEGEETKKAAVNKMKILWIVSAVCGGILVSVEAVLRKLGSNLLGKGQKDPPMVIDYKDGK